MRATPAGPDAPVVDDDRIKITLELRVAGDSFTGRATDGYGFARDFSGWLGLVAALDWFVPGAPLPLGAAALQTATPRQEEATE
jgi:hypothetical protein